MSRRGYQILRFSIFILFVVCFFSRAFNPPLADEMAFTRPLQRWIEFGPERWGVWHSPFYPWAMSLAGKIFGSNVAAYRSIGFVSILGSALFILRSIKIARPEVSESEVSLLWFVSLLAPVSLGSALLLDYDNTLLVFTTSLFFYALIALEKIELSGIKKSLILGGAIGLCLLAKETTPLIYPLAVWILLGSFPLAFLSGVFAVLLFCIFTLIWCSFFQIPFQAVFDMDLLGLKIHGAGAGTADPLSRRLYVILVPVFWMGIPLCLLFTTKIREIFLKSKAIRGILVILIGIFLAYTFALRQMTYHFPKYMAPALIWIPVLIMMVKSDEIRSKTLLWLFGMIAVGLLLPDPLMPLYERNASSLLWPLIFFAIPFLIFFIFRMLKKDTPSWQTICLFSFAALTTSYCRATLLKPYSTTYWYGDQAVPEAIARIEKWRTNPKNRDGRVVSSSEDISFSTQGIEYVPYFEAVEKTKAICESSVPVLFVSRIRESTSILIGPEFEGLKNCFEVPTNGKDVLFTELKRAIKR